jgi:hypothetical protein
MKSNNASLRKVVTQYGDELARTDTPRLRRQLGREHRPIRIRDEGQDGGPQVVGDLVALALSGDDE